MSGTYGDADILVEVLSRAVFELEVMRQPMDDEVVATRRAQGALAFPANFSLIAAMNPSACGGGIPAAKLERALCFD